MDSRNEPLKSKYLEKNTKLLMKRDRHLRTEQKSDSVSAAFLLHGLVNGI